MTESKTDGTRKVQQLVSRNLPLVLQALWDAGLWQDSIADAHHHALEEWNRCAENTRTAKAADKQGKRYRKLHDQLKAANAWCDSAPGKTSGS